MPHTPGLAARRRQTFSLASLAALFCLVAAAPAAYAAPGDNGDVKIHASTTPVDSQNDDTHVCLFYLDAFNFDGLQNVTWSIAQQPPTGTAQVSGGMIVLDRSGDGKSGTMSFPAGHYKLTWTFTGEHGSAKSKVFMSDCTGPSSSPSTSASASASASPSKSASMSPSASPSASASASSSPSPSGTGAGGSPSPGAGGHGKGHGRLAATGSALVPMVGCALALMLGGSVAARRSRRSSRGH